MDPILKLYQSMKQALADGYTMDEVNAELQRRGYGRPYSDLQEHALRIQDDQARGSRGTPKELMSSVADAATLGIGAKVAARLGSLIPGQGTYEQFLGRIREPIDKFHERRPGVAAAVDIGTGLASMPLLPGGPAKSFLGAVRQGGETGAIYGALSGLGHSRPGEELKGALKGGLFGGAVGLPFGAAAGGLRALMPSAERTLADAIGASEGGVPAVRARAAQMAPRGGLLADLSPQLRREGEFAATYGPGIRHPIGEELVARQSGQAERLNADFRNALRQSPLRSRRLKVLEGERRSWAQGPDGYGQFDPEASVQGGLEFFQQPKVADAVNDARQLNFIGTMPNPTPEGVYTFGQLHQVKRRLDQAVSNAFAKGDGELGQRLGQVRDELLDVIDQSTPGYKQVGATYRRLLDRERALDLGFKTSRTRIDPEELRTTFDELPPEAQQEFRYGLAAGFRQQLQGARTSTNVAQRLVNASKGDEQMLRLVFDNDAAFERFMHGAKMERDMAATLRRAFGGSETAERLGMTTGAQVAGGALSPWRAWQVMGRVGLKMGSDRARAATAERMGKYLFEGPDLQRVIDAILAKAKPGAPAAIGQRVIPGAAGILTGNWITDQR